MWSEDDAAFVLGALDPPAMHSFQQHLPGCPTCRASVEELRGLPGLLARLLPGGAAAAGAGTLQADSEPPKVLPGLLVRIGRERRRARLRATTVSAAAAVLAAAAGAVIAFSATEADTALPSAQPATELTMVAAPGVPVEVTLLVTGRGWGTSITTRCRYLSNGERADPARSGTETVTYGLYAVQPDRDVVLVSSWQHRQGTEIDVPGSTGLDLSEILRLEVRDESGLAVLTAYP